MSRVLVLLAVISLASSSRQSIGSFCAPDITCHLIRDLAEMITTLKLTNSSHITIRLDGPARIPLSQVLLFEDLSPTLESLSLEGSNTIISCSQSQNAQLVHAGLYFSKVDNISLKDITIEGCGVRKEISRTGANYSSAVSFALCSNIYAENVDIRGSQGSALTLMNNSGNVDFIECVFEDSRLPAEERTTHSGGNGVLMFLKDVNNSMVTFRNCIFSNNNATPGKSRYRRTEILFGYGGGIYLAIANASNNSVMIEGCIFRQNKAIWGGGLFLLFLDHPRMNNISVRGTIVDENQSYSKSALGGGGGMDVGFLLGFDKDGRYGDNFMRFVGCNFTRNTAALYGGGISVFSTKLLSSDPETHFLTFEDCLWEENSAVSGSAVDIAPNIDQIHINGVYPVPQFIDCKFISNYLITTPERLTSNLAENNSNENLTEFSATLSQTGEGTVLITGFTVQLLGTTLITSNNGSGVYLSSGSLILCENSSVTFLNNTGRNGGGLYIMTFGKLVVHNNVNLEFRKNTALLKGGAIYAHSKDPHEYIVPRGCFIQYHKATTMEDSRGIQFTFRENRALKEDGGNDVYSSSVKTCSCKAEKNSGVMETFSCIGNVSALNFNLITGVSHFKLNQTTKPSILSAIIPGKPYYKIPLKALDEYNTSRNAIYEVLQNRDSCPLKVRSGHLSQNELQFAGELNQKVTLNLSVDTTTISFSVQSSKLCPPGLLHNDGECICGNKKIFGISFCNDTNSFILHGFWIGFCDKNSKTVICSSHCPLGFCQYKNDDKGAHPLPLEVESVSEYVCDENRTGLLCGQCVENTSTYYHSYMFQCGEESLCKLGMLFYALSELLPLTLMFFFIIIFDVKFTTGTVNGFIFYSQVLDSISIDANGAIRFPKFFNVITDIHRFIYRTLNFDFFSLESLSFCLWPNASSLDALAMKYVTVIYAFVLLILLIIFMNTGKCKRAFSCWRPRTLQSSAKHGITAFIVICYSQCARVSFQILSPAYLYAENFTIERTVVFRRGDYDSFSPEHNRYAVPAIAVLLIISVVPALLLLYPLIFKLLSLLRLNDSKLSSLIWHLFPIPLMDSFQSSFKDSCRFFAGLYFLYRLLALAAWAYSPTLIVFYTFVEVQLIIVLALHSVVQPYKDKWHNIIDSLIFANLALINSFTLFNFFWVIIVGGKSIDVLKLRVIEASLSFQAILIYTPLLCVGAYFTAVAIRKLRGRFCQRVSALSDSVELPPLRVESEGVSEEYHSKRNPLLVNYTSDF